MVGQNIVEALGIPADARVELVGAFTGARSAPEGTLDVAVVNASYGATVEAFAKTFLDLWMRLAPGGRMWIVGDRYFPPWMIQRGDRSSVSDFAQSYGFVPVATAQAQRERAVAFERPELTPEQTKILRRRFALDSVKRVAVLGSPSFLLAPLQAALPPSARFYTSFDPGTGKLDLVFNIEHTQTLGSGAAAMRRRLAGGGRFVAVWRTAWGLDPATPRRNLVREGLARKDSPAPLPVGEDWLAQVFELAETEARAPSAKKKRTPAKRPAAPRRPVEPKKRPPLPSGKRPRPKTVESEEDVAAHLSHHERRACVIDKLVRAGDAITSMVGQRTWARAGEPWPEDRGYPLVHELSIRVDELSFVPGDLRDVAFLSIFAHGEELLVRAYPSLDALEPIEAPPRGPAYPARKPVGRAVRWREVLDHPDRYDAADVLAKDRVKIDPDLIDSAYDAEYVPHYTGTKIGGWPTFIQVTISPERFVLQCGEPLDAGLYFLHRKGRGWTSVAYGH